MPPRKRHDPPTRPIHIDGGEITDDQFAGLDPDYHYACVDPNDVSAGTPAVGRYKARGYEQVIATEGGERPLTGVVTIGQPIEHMGQWLMRRPMAVHMAEVKRRSKAADDFDRKTKKSQGLDSLDFGGRRIVAGEPRESAFEDM